MQTYAYCAGTYGQQDMEDRRSLGTESLQDWNLQVISPSKQTDVAAY